MSLDGVDMCDNEKCARELEKMVEAMKGAVGMDMEFYQGKLCAVSLYSRNVATRKARLQLAATTMSSEQSGTRATGDSVWLATERCNTRHSRPTNGWRYRMANCLNTR